MAKITFVYPDFESLGVEYLMAVCLKAGHEVSFVYYDAEDIYIGRRQKEIPFQKIAKRIVESKPHVAAFSCVTDNYRFQLDCARAVKEANPRILTVFGGVHPSAVPERVLRKEEVDCVAIGEAEISFSEFLKSGDKGGSFALPDRPVKGIVFKKENSLIGNFNAGETADLDTLPFPHKGPVYSSLRSALYEYRTMTSRGCPYRCSYCFNSYFHNLRNEGLFRQRKAANVIDELGRAKKDYRSRYVYFMDDSFTTSADWLAEFCEEYKRKIALPFACIANPDYVTEKKARILGAAGCVNIQIGAQSLSEEICKEILHRRSDNAHLTDAVKWLKSAGMQVQIDHMLGIPGDTVELQEESAAFYNELKPDIVSVFWLTYYPKTAIIDIARQKNILTEGDIDDIEEGRPLTRRSFAFGGDMKDPGPYYSIAFLFNYLPILPKAFVSFLLRSRLYRLFKVKDPFFAIGLPRIVTSVLKRGDFRGRSHIVRFFVKNFSVNVGS